MNVKMFFQNVAMVCDGTAQKFDLLSEDSKCSYFFRQFQLGETNLVLINVRGSKIQYLL